MADPVVRGERELTDFLKGFAGTLERKALNRIMRAGGRPVVRIAKGKVRSRSGKLASQIRVTVVRNRRTGWMTARIIAGRRVKKDDAFYAWMVEGGTKPHEIRPKGKKSLFLAGVFSRVVQHPGADPQPFLGPALEEGANEALEAMRAEMAAQIEALGTGGPL